MKRLCFHYHMDISFNSPICNHRFTLKCLPQSGEYQDVYNLKYNVYPNQYINKSCDSFGNLYLTGYAPESHSEFYVDVTGFAVTGKRSQAEMESTIKVGHYKYHSNITRPEKTLKNYFSAFTFESSQSNFDKTIIMMNKLHDDFKYKKNVTNVNTTAEEALCNGSGVCQDYSHILISLCQMAKIPARYVVGLLLGEGYSHAWVEIFQEDSESQGHWIAVDPTNNIVVTDSHVKISNGKDYKDCMINQGIFTGNAVQTQNISVIVYEAHHSKIWRKHDKNSGRS